MADIAKAFINFFFSKDFTVSAKIRGFIIIVACLFLIDNIVGFSFYYNMSHKMEQLDKVENLKKDYKNDRIALRYLNEAQLKIINRKNVFQSFWGLFSPAPIDVLDLQNDTISLDKDLINLGNPPETIKDQLRSQKSRSQLIHTLTSSFLYILLILVVIIGWIEDRMFSFNELLGLLISIVMICIIIFINQFLFGLIPVIKGNPVINYVLNVVLHVSITGVFIYIGKKKEKSELLDLGRRSGK